MERTVSIRPLAVSAAARAALRGCTPTVRAAHRLGVTVQLAGSDDAVLLGGRGMGLLPAHVVVRARDRERVLRAQADPKRERSAATALHVDLDGVRTFQCRLAPDPAIDSAAGRANLSEVARWLCASASPLGLGATAAELLAPTGRWSETFRALRGDGQPPLAAVRALVGRGAGTTPAGDDVLIGAVAHAWVAHGAAAPLVTAVRLLEPELGSLTTAVAATYLRAAARGEFGSHLVAWARALPRVSASRTIALARRVAAHGTTSGHDTLVGFLAAAR